MWSISGPILPMIRLELHVVKTAKRTTKSIESWWGPRRHRREENWKTVNNQNKPPLSFSSLRWHGLSSLFIYCYCYCSCAPLCAVLSPAGWNYATLEGATRGEYTWTAATLREEIKIIAHHQVLSFCFCSNLREDNCGKWKSGVKLLALWITKLSNELQKWWSVTSTKMHFLLISNYLRRIELIK